MDQKGKELTTNAAKDDGTFYVTSLGRGFASFSRPGSFFPFFFLPFFRHTKTVVYMVECGLRGATEIFCENPVPLLAPPR